MAGPVRTALRQFLDHEAAGGLLLMGVAALALVIANSPFGSVYASTLHVEVLGLSLLHWINDGLMALFFLLVGLEIKRELLQGGLNSWSSRILPGVAALGGMAAPALIYVGFNAGSPQTIAGWAIPSATDIAFALGVLSLLGSRVPLSLKIFLAALAILDDLGAVLIIALFYTANLSLPMLAASGAVIVMLAALNLFRVRSLPAYLALGALLWFFVFRSGIHATLAGVALAFAIPLGAEKGEEDARAAPLARLEHGLHPWVAFAVVPIFGFANAGVSFAGLTLATLVAPLPLGVAAGLFVGKQAGVFLFAWAAIRMKWAQLPAKATWPQLYGVALLCGIGFTMSLFIGLLAFPDAPRLHDAVKVGVLAGSVASAAAGALLLLICSPPSSDAESAT